MNETTCKFEDSFLFLSDHSNWHDGLKNSGQTLQPVKTWDKDRRGKECTIVKEIQHLILMP